LRRLGVFCKAENSTRKLDREIKNKKYKKTAAKPKELLPVRKMWRQPLTGLSKNFQVSRLN